MRFSAVAVLMLMLMGVAMVMLMRIIILIVCMDRAFVDAEFHSFDAAATRPLEVHVEIADIELCEFPLERRRLHTEIAQSTHGHVAADAGEAVEKKNAHGN
jgi:hypothetical protein